MKAGTQEHGTKCGMEVMWFHTGNYTEMMHEPTKECITYQPVYHSANSAHEFCCLVYFLSHTESIYRPDLSLSHKQRKCSGVCKLLSKIICLNMLKTSLVPKPLAPEEAPRDEAS